MQLPEEQHVTPTTLDTIDEALDRFELDWTAESLDLIPSLVSSVGLADDMDAITELLRVDIDLRYAKGIPVDLASCLQCHPDLGSHPALVSQIVYEDYRSRLHHELSIDAARWNEIPGIETQPWFMLLGGKDADVDDTLCKAFVADGQLTVPVLDSAMAKALAGLGFEMVGEIGHGAFSRVYLARQNDLARRLVVLKVVRRAFSEPRNLAMLQHTNIVPIYSFDTIPGHSVICMPFAGRRTLADFVDSRSSSGQVEGAELLSTVAFHSAPETLKEESPAAKLQAQERMHTGDLIQKSAAATDQNAPARNAAPDLPETTPEMLAGVLASMDRNSLGVWIFRQLASALAHSHDKGILHGDLKPANVIMRDDGHPSLIDFNLAQTNDHSGDSIVGGTLAYMPPELYGTLTGESPESQPTSDLYSFGVMQYQFHTGRLPFERPPTAGSDDLAIAAKIRDSELAWRDDDAVTNGIKCIVAKCLAYDPALRYQSCHELEADLQREDTGRSLKYATEPNAARFRKWRRRNITTLRTSLFFSVLALLAIVASTLAYQSRKNNSQLHEQALFEAFEEDSVLAIVNAKHGGINDYSLRVEMLEAVLDDHDIHPETIADRVASLPGDYRARGIQQVVLHAGHLGYAELRRVRSSDDRRSADASNAQLNRSFATLKQVWDFGNSRLCLQLASARLRLEGRTAEHKATREKWLEIESDVPAEVYFLGMWQVYAGQAAVGKITIAALEGELDFPKAIILAAAAASDLELRDTWPAALKITRLMQLIPESAYVYYFRGRCLRTAGRYRDALADQTRALELRPDYVAARFQRAWLYRNLKEDDKALVDAQAAFAFQPKRVIDYYLMADIYRGLGQPEKAEAELVEMLKAIPADTESRLKLARVQLKSGSLEVALRIAEEAERNDADSAAVQKLLFHIYGDHIQDDAKGLEAAQRSVDLSGDDSYQFAGLAVAQARVGQFEAALKSIEAAKKTKDMDRGWTAYKFASAYAQIPGHENQQLAITYLTIALTEGIGHEIFETDRDLVNLRNHQEYRNLQTIMKRVGSVDMSYTK